MMKKQVLSMLSVLLAAALVMSGCTFKKIAEGLKDKLESGASEMASGISSAADDISKDISEAVSDASEEIASEIEKSEETSSETESEKETESETESESESDTESEEESESEKESEKESAKEEKPEEKELPVVLHLLDYTTSRYISRETNGTYERLLGMEVEDVSLASNEQLSLYNDLLDVLEKKKLDNWNMFEQL
ncbi:MAG: hypothetical protein IKR59_06505, partial [Lachnospiraceae bacterium]|nr:hypothetical protein [Lachnospiraceae bacterium]